MKEPATGLARWERSTRTRVASGGTGARKLGAPASSPLAIGTTFRRPWRNGTIWLNDSRGFSGHVLLYWLFILILLAAAAGAALLAYRTYVMGEPNVANFNI